MKLSSLLMPALAAAAPSSFSSRPKALIYRGPAACNGCPESVAHLLKSSSYKFEVTYAGPKEKVDIDESSLDKVDIVAFPGGPDLNKNWRRSVHTYAPAVRSFVSNGGIYMGFCLGAYFAGDGYFGLLPDNSTCAEECNQPGAQVTNRANTMIQVDWTFAAGPKAGTTEERWAFFQDGPVIKLKGDAGTADGAKILARYASDNDIAATLTPYGKGWVANTGAHLEADKSWCKRRDINLDRELDS